MDVRAVDRAAEGEPEWRVAERRGALTQFEALDKPDPRVEEWRYVELDFDLGDYRLVDTPGEPGDGSLGTFSPSHRIVVVDGIVTSQEPGPPEADAPLWVGGLAEAVTQRPDPLRRLDGNGVPSGIDQFAAAHAAFGGGGALIHAGRNTVTGPILVEVHAATSGVVSFPRIVVVADDTAQVAVVVHLTSRSDVDALMVPQIEVLGGSGANVAVTVVQNLGPEMRSIGHARAVLGRDANLVLAEAGLGGRFSRLRLAIDLEGRGSSADVVGAYFGDRSQVLDYRYVMHHAGLNTRSNMFLKGAVEDDALSVFTGMIRIDEGAQRTDAFQTNRNLILSEGAAAQSVPNLEILANDVKCGHGSTVGPLDQEQRYYLMSRGLDPQRADRLQVRGFFEEALGRFPTPEVTPPLREWINGKFVEAQEEGRV